MDYSITKRAHTPTPGVYMGKPTRSSYDDRGGGGGGGRYDDDDYYDRGKRKTTWRERDSEGKTEEKIRNIIFFFTFFQVVRVEAVATEGRSLLFSSGLHYIILYTY